MASEATFVVHEHKLHEPSSCSRHWKAWHRWACRACGAICVWWIFNEQTKGGFNGNRGNRSQSATGGGGGGNSVAATNVTQIELHTPHIRRQWCLRTSPSHRYSSYIRTYLYFLSGAGCTFPLCYSYMYISSTLLKTLQQWRPFYCYWLSFWALLQVRMYVHGSIDLDVCMCIRNGFTNMPVFLLGMSVIGLPPIDCATVLCAEPDCFPSMQYTPPGQCCPVCKRDVCARVRCAALYCYGGYSYVPLGECCPVCVHY